MRAKTVIWILVVTLFLIGLGYMVHRTKNGNEKPLYKTKKFEKRKIVQIINATGAIEAENTIKVGSLINGVIKELFVEENEKVKKGQLIALLDNGKSDTDVKRTAGLVRRSEARVRYLKAFLKRQQMMFEDGHISKNDLELAQSNYDEAVGFLDERKASYEKAVMDFENTKILSPVDGVVLKKNVSLGEGVSSFLNPTVIYTIAQDLTKMKVELEVDETSIGDLKVGEKAILTFDTYPNKEFKGIIKEINNGPTIAKGTVSYKSYIYLKNDDLLLKPGMTVHADIIVGKKKDIFAIPGYVFAINPKLIELAAKEKKYGYKPLTKQGEKRFRKKMRDKERPIKKVWVLENNTFVEKPVEIGVTDKIYFEIISGLDENDQVVVDIEETDAMKQMFQRLFGKGLSK